MEVMILIEKTGKHFTRFMKMLQERREIRATEIIRAMPRSSYYATLLSRVLKINAALREIDSRLFLAEPYFSVANRKQVFTSIRKCELIEIDTIGEFFVVRCKHEKE